MAIRRWWLQRSSTVITGRDRRGSPVLRQPCSRDIAGYVRLPLELAHLVLIAHGADALGRIGSVVEMGPNAEKARPGAHVPAEVDDVALDLHVEPVAGLEPGFLRASLGTAIWFLVLIFTLSMNRMPSTPAPYGKRMSKGDVRGANHCQSAAAQTGNGVRCGGGAPRAPLHSFAARRPAPDAGNPPTRAGRPDDALLPRRVDLANHAHARRTSDAAVGGGG
jgi:hypothetical protein